MKHHPRALSKILFLDVEEVHQKIIMRVVKLKFKAKVNQHKHDINMNIFYL